MGIIRGKFITGKVGNMVYKPHQGKQVVQSKPYTPKSHLTEETVKASKVFGRASQLAHSMRLGLGYAYGRFYDGTMVYRLNKEVLHCLRSCKNEETQDFDIKLDTFNSLVGFEFNADSPVKNQFYRRPVIQVGEGKLKITIPPLEVPTDLKFMPNSRICRLLIAPTMIDLVNGRFKYMLPQMMEIPRYADGAPPASPHTFEFEIEPGCLCITAISLQYVEQTFAGDFILNTKSFNPAAILHAYIAEGEVKAEATKEWNSSDFTVVDKRKKNKEKGAMNKDEGVENKDEGVKSDGEGEVLPSKDQRIPGKPWRMLGNERRRET